MTPDAVLTGLASLHSYVHTYHRSDCKKAASETQTGFQDSSTPDVFWQMRALATVLMTQDLPRQPLLLIS